MNKQARRSRTRRIMAIGALIGTLVSVGAISDNASAAKSTSTNDGGATIVVQVDASGGTTSMSSGVRW